MDFRFRLQAGKRYTYVENGMELQMLIGDLLDGSKGQPKMSLKDISITVEKAPVDPEREWKDVED